MGAMGWQHWLLLAVIVLLLFGKGKVSDLMGDVAKGLKSFKKGLAEEDESPKPQVRIDTVDAAPRTVEAQRAPQPEETRQN